MIIVFMLCAVIITVRNTVCKNIMIPMGKQLLQQSKCNDIERLDRFATVGFKFAYFSCITLWGWNLFAGLDWFPSQLGGTTKGTIDNCFEISAQTSRIETMTNIYINIQTAYHWHSLLLHLFSKIKRNDFVEMLIHHVATVLLLFVGAYYHESKMVCATLFVHDIADVFGYLVNSLLIQIFKYRLL